MRPWTGDFNDTDTEMTRLYTLYLWKHQCGNDAGALKWVLLYYQATKRVPVLKSRFNPIVSVERFTWAGLRR